MNKKLNRKQNGTKTKESIKRKNTKKMKLKL